MPVLRSTVPVRPSLSSLAVKLGLFISAVLLFVLSFPGSLSERGWGFLALAALVPVFLLVRKVSWPGSLVWGGLYGWSTYALFNSWLASFNPLAFQIVPAIYLVYGLVLFPGLKYLSSLALPWRPAALALGWVAYEFLKTQGFLGYSYGVLGYAFWENGLMLQSAAWGGVWALSLLAALAGALGAELLPALAALVQKKEFPSLAGLAPGAALFLGLTSFMVAWGFLSPLDFTGMETWRPALIQHDMDPWKDGDDQYRQGTGRLTALSLQALEQNPQALVWSETAVVPSLMYHRKYREDTVRYQTVEEVFQFASGLKIPLVLGNGHGERRMVPGGGGNWERIDYNSVFVFQGTEPPGRYDKVHLVPFTEHFPFGGLLEPFRDYLRNGDTHFWEAGKDFRILQAGPVKVGTPVCFEDTFGYISREFVRGGADVLVNLTNDSWSGVKDNMYQHYAISVFRAVENRRSLVRSTSGGITAAVDPNGRILGELKPFTQGILAVDVPVVKGTGTLYTAWGDWLGWLSLLLTGLFFILGIPRGKKT